MKNRALSILLAEDEAAHAEAVRRSIRSGIPRARLRVASTLAEYRRLAAAEKPDLAILDLNLPDGRAVEVLTFPPEDGPFPVILMTSHGDEQIAVEAMKAGALDYLVKSSESFGAMPRTVERTLESWKALQDRRRAEQALREREAVLAAVFDNAPLIMILVDSDGTILKTNHAATVTTGRKQDELTGLLCGEALRCLNAFNESGGCGFSPECKNCTLRRAFQDSFDTGVSHYRVEAALPVDSKDSRENCYFLVSTCILNFNGKNGVLVSLEDITGRNRMQEKLQESEMLFSSLLEHSPINIFFKDINIRALRLSRNFEQLLDIPVEEALGKSMYELFPSEFARKMVEDDKRILEKGELVRIEEEYDGRNYETIKFPICKDGKPYMLAGFTLDITERKRMENALAESEQKYRLMAENISDVFWIATPDISKMIYVSPAYETIWGRSCESLYESPRSFIEAIQPEDRERILSELQQARDRETAWVTQYRIVRPDGSVRWIEDRGFPVLDEQGNYCLNTGTSEDITRRKLAEDELSRSERKFRTVFRDSPIGLELYDTDGILVDANRACLDIFGVADIQQVLGFRLFEDPNIPESVKDLLREGKKAAYNITFDFEKVRELGLYQTTKNGNIIIHTIVAPLGWDGQKAVGGYLVQVADVTEHRQLEEEREATLNVLRLLNASNSRMELMKSVLLYLKNWSGCEAIGIRLKEGDDYPYYVTSGFDDNFVEAESQLCARDEAGDGNILLDSNFNPVLECMCGNIICGRFNPALPFFTENGSFWTNCTTELLASTTEAERQARTRNRCNGVGFESVALVPLRFGDQAFGLLQVNDRRRGCFTPDKIKTFERLAGNLAIGLAQRKSIEELRSSQERLNFVIAGARLGWWDWDIQTGQVTRSQNWADMLGYTLEEAQEPSLFRKSMHPEDIAWSDRIVSRHLEGRIPFFEYEARLHRKSGDNIWILSRGRTVDWDVDGKPIRVTGTIQDITSQKQLEKEREKSSRLESVGLLAGGIAHDFNNILTTALGNINLARLTVLEDPAKAIEIIAEAESAIMKSKSLTQQLLTFSKGGEPQKKLFCVKMLITENTLFALRGSRIKGEFDFPKEQCIVEADAGQISQVVNNIVINALQAMPNGGKLDVRVARESIGSENKLKLEPGEYVRLEFRDHGIGIPPEHLGKIFDPYFTTKPKGSGLGLAVSYSIIKKHGGVIEAESTPGSGTVFSLLLPASSGKPVEIVQKTAVDHSVAGRILLMDDEDGIRALVSAMLRRMGHEVVATVEGGEAVTLYRQALQTGRHFDAVILDLTVQGGLGGKETIKLLKAMDPDVKAVVSSGYSADDVCSRPREYGFLESISKPFMMQDLKAVLERVMKLEV